MKALYLSLSVILTVLILILAFENITADCQQILFLFFPIKSNPTFLTFGVAVLGILTGMVYHAFLNKTLEEPEENADDAF